MPSPRLERPLVVGCALAAGAHPQARLVEEPGHPDHGPSVGIQVHRVPARLVAVQRAVTHLERELEVPARREHPVELREHRGHRRRRDVDERVPGDHSGETAIGQVERGHRADREGDAGVGAMRHRDHLR